MFPVPLRVANYAFLVLFIGGFAYTYGGSPPESAARLMGGLLPIAVLALTVFAIHADTRKTHRAALVANSLLCLLATVVMLYVAIVGALAIAIVSFLPFALFFVNVYFLARQREQQSAL